MMMPSSQSQAVLNRSFEEEKKGPPTVPAKELAPASDLTLDAIIGQ